MKPIDCIKAISMMQHGYSYFFCPGIISLVQFRWSRDGHVLCYLVGIASINFIKEQTLLLLFKQIHFTFKMKTTTSIIFLYKLWVRISRVSFGLLNGMFHPRYWILMSTPGPGWPKAWYFWYTAVFQRPRDHFSATPNLRVVKSLTKECVM